MAPVETGAWDRQCLQGLQRWGLSFWLPYQLAPRPAFYSFDILSRFLRPPAGAASLESPSVIDDALAENRGTLDVLDICDGRE